MAAGLAVMARSKRTEIPQEPSGPSPADERTTVINLKGSLLFDEWFDGIHAKTHLPKATIVRLALRDWAERNGHDLPPPI